MASTRDHTWEQGSLYPPSHGIASSVLRWITVINTHVLVRCLPSITLGLQPDHIAATWFWGLAEFTQDGTCTDSLILGEVGFSFIFKFALEEV